MILTNYRPVPIPIHSIAMKPPKDAIIILKQNLVNQWWNEILAVKTFLMFWLCYNNNIS